MQHLLITLDKADPLLFMDLYDLAAAAGNVDAHASVLLRHAACRFAVSVEYTETYGMAHLAPLPNKMLASLPLYDVEEIFVLQADLLSEEIPTEHLQASVTVLESVPTKDVTIEL